MFVGEQAFLNKSLLTVGGSQQRQESTLSEKMRGYLIDLEGECKISKFQYIKVSYLKTFFFVLPVTLSIIGLIIVFHFKTARAKLFYSPTNDQEASHVYVKSQDEISSICQLIHMNIKGRRAMVFKFEELTYQISHGKYLPLGMDLQNQIPAFLTKQFLNKGLNENEASANQSIYGKNNHLVKIPTYPSYILSALTQPLIILQYITGISYYFENAAFFAVMLIFLSFITININYLLVRKSYCKIKKLAEKQGVVQVLREGKVREVSNHDLVPGDLYFPQQDTPCDSILINRDIFVNEVNFTGQNTPIGKFALNSTNRLFQSEHWIYEGSKVILGRDNALALAVNTGYRSRKGRIIRKILHKKSQSFEFFKNLMLLVGQIQIVNLCLYVIFYQYMFDDIPNSSMIYLRFMDFTINSIPSVLTIYLNLMNTYIVGRLKSSEIISMEGEKAIEASRIQTVCFDKTGTLTESTLDIENIIIFRQNKQKKIKPSKINEHSLIHKLFASCHTVIDSRNKLQGDEMDIKMFKSANATMVKPEKQGVILQIKCDQFTLQVWRINQFESKYQSMSVLVKVKQSEEMFVFAQGSPEVIGQNRTEKRLKLIKDLSLQGYRTISIGYKQIASEIQFSSYLQYHREEYLKNVIPLALVTFKNKLKSDAKLVVKTLAEAEITVKIITGDNIFVAVQTALALQLVPAQHRVLILQGKNMIQKDKMKVIGIRKVNQSITEEEIVINIEDPKQVENQYLAMDLEFINKREDLFFSKKAIIFARATPEAKAFIIKQEKEMLKTELSHRNWKDRIFGGCVRKVAMVGDGANDLMSIKQADIGIGIINSDSMYSSNFTIKDLHQIDLIIREGKCAQRSQIEIVNHTNIFYFMLNIAYIFLTHDQSNFSSTNFMYRNFMCMYPLTAFIIFARPVEKLSKYCPSSNLIGLENQLVFWGTTIVNSSGLILAFMIYQRSDDFQQNPQKQTLSYLTKTSTFLFLTSMIISPFLILSFWQSYPWKNRIWRTLLMSFTIIVNIILIHVMVFSTDALSFMDLVTIDRMQMLKAYAICLSTVIISIAYNALIQSCHLYRYQFPGRKESPVKSTILQESD